MTTPIFWGTLRSVAAGAVLWTGMMTLAAAQTPARPNLDGIWKIATPTVELKPVSGSVPFTSEGRKAYQKNKKLKAEGKFEDYDIASSRCSMPGIPRIMLTTMRFKVWQRSNIVTFDFEWNRAFRQVNTSGIKPEEKEVPDMRGTTVGHWEGDTLVAETNDFTGLTLLDSLLPQSTDAKVTERIRLIDADTLEDRITLEDPVNFTRKWDAVLTYKRQPFAIFPEDVCLERRFAGQSALLE